MSAHAIFYSKFRSKSLPYYFFCLVCILYVALNIIYSQKYNPNMYGVMGGEVNPSTTYLRHIWGTPLYNYEIQNFVSEGRVDILNRWSDVRSQNGKRIHNLEEVAKKHPYSPELFYNLYLLYSESGQHAKAAESLSRARLIDPSIK